MALTPVLISGGKCHLISQKVVYMYMVPWDMTFKLINLKGRLNIDVTEA